MKEYIAETGGRYTYSDDILNLQELALSLTAIFDGCSNFIVSGCEISGKTVSPGYVWINGKIRYYEGCTDAVFPYYIWENNSHDTVTYANDVNKNGRCNYLCTGGKTVPVQPDPVTGKVPQFIELTVSYSPRFIDKFMGRYAVLLDTPFAKQTIRKEVVFAGKVTGETDIISKTAVTIVNESKGYALKNIVKIDGSASAGLYLNGLLVNELVIHTNGSFSFNKQGKEIAKVTENGLLVTNFSSINTQSGSVAIFDDHIINITDNTDTGAVNVNHTGYNKGTTRFRNFNVYSGKSASVPVFQVVGKTSQVQVNGGFSVRNAGTGFELTNTAYLKTDATLTNMIKWTDKTSETIGSIGFSNETTFDYTIQNYVGNITLFPKASLDIKGDLRIKGVNINSMFVSQTAFTSELKKKVDVVVGKGLSDENFTKAYKEKLNAISQGSIGDGNAGFVTAKDVKEALAKKLDISQNLKDLNNITTARTNLSVYSKQETIDGFLQKKNNLLELVTLTADEINGLTTEEIAALKAKKQETVRNNIDAEKKGTGNLKLAKASNLSDLADKVAARKNISVYSTTEIDKMLEGKLSSGSEYKGVVFTSEHKSKLESIKTGSFATVNAEGKSVAQVEGYVMVSTVVKELAKKANLLMDGYSDSQRKTIASNLAVYLKTDANTKFAIVENLFQDYITFLVKQGKTTAEAQKVLRDKLNVLSKEEVTGNYLDKKKKLADLLISSEADKKETCRVIGAAYAPEYQTKLSDTGWLQMSNSGNSTDTRELFVRQIGNMVCIQGVINTGKRDGGNWGGTVALIPNTISPPKHGVRQSYADFNSDHKYNRGASFIIQANSRKMVMYESGFNNVRTEIHFTYMI